MISGTGTVEDPIDPGRKRGWYLDAAGASARSMPRVRAVVLLDQGGRCDWRPDTSALSMQGFVDFARDPFFTGAATTAALPPPTTRPPTTTVPATSTTVTPTTKAPTTTAPPNVPPSTCSTTGGVPIGTGDNAQNVVNAHGAGTAYLVKAGTHQGNFSVQPKSGDTFCGEPERSSTAGAACGSPSTATEQRHPRLVHHPKLQPAAKTAPLNPTSVPPAGSCAT